MKQTAVECLADSLTEQYPNGKFVWNTRADIEALFKQAKEMEKQQQDEFAIGFAEWCRAIIDRVGVLEYKRKWINLSTKELLEIYKKEKGL
jgi:hypothetical protein